MAKKINFSDIARTLDAIEDGDFLKLDDLIELNKKYAKRANERLRQFKKQDMSSYAVKQAKSYLKEHGRKSFTTSKKQTVDELESNLSALTRFLNSQTASLKGEKERREKIIQDLEGDGYTINDPDALFDFFETEAWSDIKHLGSGDKLTEALEKIENGAKIDDLIKLYNEYLDKIDSKDSMDLFDVWDRWEAR